MAEAIVKLDEAIREAFGCTDSVRRTSWPAGSAGRIDYESDDVSQPIFFTFGRQHMVTIGSVDLEADDWQPYSFRGEPPLESWREHFSVRRDGEMKSISRGDPCEVTIDGLPLAGEWTLAWAVPYLISVKVNVKGVGYWPRTGMQLPLKRLALSANGVDLAFHLLQLNYWLPIDDVRLYQLEVVPVVPKA